MRFVMKPISRGTLTHSPQSGEARAGAAIGRTAASNATSRVGICRRIGEAMSAKSPATSESDRNAGTRGHGAQGRAFAHPTDCRSRSSLDMPRGPNRPHEAVHCQFRKAAVDDGGNLGLRLTKCVTCHCNHLDPTGLHLWLHVRHAEPIPSRRAPKARTARAVRAIIV
jgi:hypothetical protein